MRDSTDLDLPNSRATYVGVCSGGTTHWGRYPHRAAPFVLLPPFGAHSDAHGLGHIAHRVLLDRVVALRIRLPEWFARVANAAERGARIYLFEICESILTVCVLNERRNDSPRPRVLCIDNQSASDSLAKGPSASGLGAIIVGGILEFCGPIPRPMVDRIRQRKIK